MKYRRKFKGLTLVEVLLYTALFAILGAISIYVFLFLNKLYRVQFSKSEELEKISRIGRSVPILIQSVPPPASGLAPYMSVPTTVNINGNNVNFTSTPGYVREVVFWRINRNNFNPLNMNMNNFEEWRIGFRSPSPNAEPWNDGFIDIFPAANPANRTTFEGIEDCNFRIFNGGVIDTRGDSIQIQISVFERKFTRRVQTSYIISGR